MSTSESDLFMHTNEIVPRNESKQGNPKQVKVALTSQALYVSKAS
jgi:hypothetical protein